MLRSLKKAIVLLDAFTAETPEWSLADLSRRLRIPKPTAHHILSTLVDTGWVARDPASKKYRLGVRLWEKGWLAVHQMGLREVARPLVENLVREAGETVRLAALDPADPRYVIYIDQVEGNHAVRADTMTTLRAPAYCVATGKAILAFHPDAARRLLARPLRAYTERTLTDPGVLERELAITRRRGFSVNKSEYRPDVVGIGAPIRNHEGQVVAAVGVSGPAYRLTEEAIRRIAPVVMATARDVSAQLGYRDNRVPAGGSDSRQRRRRTPAGSPHR